LQGKKEKKNIKEICEIFMIKIKKELAYY